MRRILRFSVFVCLCLFTLAQCGLEFLPYLTPPNSLVPGLSSFKVEKVTANDSEKEPNLPPPQDYIWKYLGIELYYKLYLPDSEPGGGVPSAEKNYTTLSALESNGFTRITSFPDESRFSTERPLIDIDIDDPPTGQGDLRFSIELSSLSIEKDGVGVVVAEIRRGVLYDSVEDGDPNYRPFLWDDDEATGNRGFAASHADVGADVFDFMNTKPAQNISMVMYALSYGKTDGMLTDFYSDAVCLGEVDINFGW